MICYNKFIMKKIAVIPIDNRPVCYSLFESIAKIDDDIQLFLPDRKLLGGLKSIAKTDWILRWFEGIDKVDAVIVCLDTIAYGGLIPSRRCENTFDEIKAKMEAFKKLLKGKKVYAFSSIMRISNNNVNEEEKEYWDIYGKKIFEYSYNFHKNGDDKSDVPFKILEDYMLTRKRNFEINKMYLEWLEDGVFETLVFSKDDCAEYGLNVLEAGILEGIIKKKELKGQVKTGADEIPLTLFARAITDMNTNKLKVSPKFLAPQYKNLISNYEDISIEKSVMAQLELAGCNIVEDTSADVVLLVNNFEEAQGEIVMERPTKPFSGVLNVPNKPFMVADVRFANGADNAFVERLLENNLASPNFYGYSAWNTSANTLGSLICACVVKFFATNYNDKAFKELQMIRFLDDWAYQANIRQVLKAASTKPSVLQLKPFMIKFEKRLGAKFGIEKEIEYKFPWDRFFEVEVVVK